MRSIKEIEKDIQEFTKELIPLVCEDGKLFRQGCNSKNTKRINEIVVRLDNLRLNLNQAKQRIL